eukprot:5568709-Pyramimonas_sp.AAC.1
MLHHMLWVLDQTTAGPHGAVSKQACGFLNTMTVSCIAMLVCRSSHFGSTRSGSPVLLRPQARDVMPIVSSFAEAFRWVEHAVGSAAVALGETEDEVRDMIARGIKRCFTISTCFTGVSGPDHASESILCYMNKWLPGGDAYSIEHTFGFEHDEECQNELRLLEAPPTCLFTDINSIWNPNVAWTLGKAMESDRSRL